MRSNSNHSLGEPFKTKEGKYNLQIIDHDPGVKNITYMGITEDLKTKIQDDFVNEEVKFLHFVYDLGEVMVLKSTVHTLVFQEYVSFDEMENGPDPEAPTPVSARIYEEDAPRDTNGI